MPTHMLTPTHTSTPPPSTTRRVNTKTTFINNNKNTP